MPTDYGTRKCEVAWKYQLTESRHQVKIKELNPKKGYRVRLDDLIIYGSEEVKKAWKTN